jgi:hypothetical protein
MAEPVTLRPETVTLRARRIESRPTFMPAGWHEWAAVGKAKTKRSDLGACTVEGPAAGLLRFFWGGCPLVRCIDRSDERRRARASE